MKEDQINIRKSIKLGRPVYQAELDKPMLKWLQGLIIFMAVAAVGNVLAYFMDLSGVILGLLAVLVVGRVE